MNRHCLSTVAALFLALPATLSAQESIPTPADGFGIHVTAPHMVNGVRRGPFHHYCKPISPEPIIQCILFESTEPNAPLVEIEYIVAKSLTRTDIISLEDWNTKWHDHLQEINTGRVKVLDMAPEDAAKVIELVKTTDGIIFHLWPTGARLPTGDVMIPQSVGHVNISAEEKFGYSEQVAEEE